MTTRKKQSQAQVLLKPQIKKEIKPKKDKKVNSQGINRLNELAETYLQDKARAIEEGKPVIWGGGGWEAPLLYACDTIPLPLSELWRVNSQEAAALGENHFQIPGEFCSMVKAALGGLYARKDGKINRILTFCAGCEPMNVAKELIIKEGYDVHYLEAVSLQRFEKVQYEQGIDLLVRNLNDTAKWLTGKLPDEEKLRLRIKQKNEVLRKTGTIMDLRLKAPRYLKGTATQQIILGAGHYYGNFEEYIKVLDKLIEELKEEASKEQNNDDIIPLVFAGQGGSASLLFQTIEEGGGVLSGWVSATSFERFYDENIPPVESLARYLLDGQLAGELGEMGGGAATLRRKRIEGEIDKTGARGVVLYGVTACPYATIVRQMEREYFKNLGVPVINLEGTVFKEPPNEDQLNTVKTFLEMLA